MVRYASKANQDDIHLHRESTGEGAFQFLEQSLMVDSEPLPHLILLDLDLPTISGIDLLKKIRAHPELSHLQTVIVSTSNDPKELEAARTLGVRSFISKGGDLKTFQNKLMECVDSILDG